MEENFLQNFSDCKPCSLSPSFSTMTSYHEGQIASSIAEWWALNRDYIIVALCMVEWRSYWDLGYEESPFIVTLLMCLHNC